MPSARTLAREDPKIEGKVEVSMSADSTRVAKPSSSRTARAAWAYSHCARKRVQSAAMDAVHSAILAFTGKTKSHHAA